MRPSKRQNLEVSLMTTVACFFTCLCILKTIISYHVVYFSGVGKTTLAKTLSTELSCKVFVEPATENPYLEKFYKQPNKFALPLQLWILQQRYHTYVNATKHVLNTGMKYEQIHILLYNITGS